MHPAGFLQSEPVAMGPSSHEQALEAADDECRTTWKRRVPSWKSWLNGLQIIAERVQICYAAFFESIFYAALLRLILKLAKYLSIGLAPCFFFGVTADEFALVSRYNIDASKVLWKINHVETNQLLSFSAKLYSK